MLQDELRWTRIRFSIKTGFPKQSTIAINTKICGKTRRFKGSWIILGAKRNRYQFLKQRNTWEVKNRKSELKYYNTVIFFVCGCAMRHVGSQFPDQGLNPEPLQWKQSLNQPRIFPAPSGKSQQLSSFLKNVVVPIKKLLLCTTFISFQNFSEFYYLQIFKSSLKNNSFPYNQQNSMEMAQK